MHVVGEHWEQPEAVQNVKYFIMLLHKVRVSLLANLNNNLWWSFKMIRLCSLKMFKCNPTLHYNIQHLFAYNIKILECFIHRTKNRAVLTCSLCFTCTKTKTALPCLQKKYQSFTVYCLYSYLIWHVYYLSTNHLIMYVVCTFTWHFIRNTYLYAYVFSQSYSSSAKHLVSSSWRTISEEWSVVFPYGIVAIAVTNLHSYDYVVSPDWLELPERLQ